MTADARRDDGMTLVEVSVALVILSGVLAALAAFLITSIKTQHLNELRAKAVQVGQQQIEDARALPWELTGFYADDAAASSCGADVVTLPVPASGIKSTRVATAGQKTRTVDGRSYTTTTCYRWKNDTADDAADGTDPDGTKDVKAIDVTMQWSVAGASKTLKASGVRAPTAQEVTPKSGTSSQPFGILSVTPVPNSGYSASVDVNGRTASAIAFTAATTTNVATVQLRWVDAAGVQHLQALTQNGSTTAWAWTMPTGTGPFPAATTTFKLSATSSTGETSAQDTTVAFSATAGTLVIDGLTATPNSVDVSSSGASAVAFTVSATTAADVTSMNLIYRTRSGGSATVPMTISSLRAGTYTFPAGSGPFPDGVVEMKVVASGATGTATRSVDVTFVAPLIVAVSVDSANVAPRLCVAQNNGQPTRSTVVDVVVTGLSATDAVVLQFNDNATTKVNAQHVSSSGTASLFRYSISPSSELRFQGRTTMSVSVAATRASDKTQATRAYAGFPIFIKNGNDVCPSTP